MRTEKTETFEIFPSVNVRVCLERDMQDLGYVRVIFPEAWSRNPTKQDLTSAVMSGIQTLMERDGIRATFKWNNNECLVSNMLSDRPEMNEYVCHAAISGIMRKLQRLKVVTPDSIKGYLSDLIANISAEPPIEESRDGFTASVQGEKFRNTPTHLRTLSHNDMRMKLMAKLEEVHDKVFEIHEKKDILGLIVALAERAKGNGLIPSGAEHAAKVRNDLTTMATRAVKEYFEGVSPDQFNSFIFSAVDIVYGTMTQKSGRSTNT